MKTTRTAVYVAVAIKISELLLLIIALRKNPNRRTEQETVTRLLVRFVLKLMMSMGTISKAPPERAIIVLAMIRTDSVACFRV